MKLPMDMVERAARAYHNAACNADGAWDTCSGMSQLMYRDLMRAALEAALSGCAVGNVQSDDGDLVFLDDVSRPWEGFNLIEDVWVGKRVALVPLED